MKIPRDMSGEYLATVLTRFGYTITRRSGSHIRLSTQRNGTHHITIPAHESLKIGMLNALLNDIAEHHGVSKEELIEILFS